MLWGECWGAGDTRVLGELSGFRRPLSPMSCRFFSSFFFRGTIFSLSFPITRELPSM